MKTKVILLAFLLVLMGCSSNPKNTTGAAYDADSYYCRELSHGNYEVKGQIAEEDIQSNYELYQQHCEPIANWTERDADGYKKSMKREKSFFSQLIDELFHLQP